MATVGHKAVQRTVIRARAETLKREKKAVGIIVASIERFVKKSLRKHGPPGPTNRTRDYSKSIRSRVSSSGLRAEGRVGTRIKYAPTHEYGATRTPVNRKWLTIPTAGSGSSPTDPFCS